MNDSSRSRGGLRSRHGSRSSVTPLLGEWLMLHPLMAKVKDKGNDSALVPPLEDH